MLLAAAAIAILWANSPWSGAYFGLWGAKSLIGAPESLMSRPLHFWISDGLMAFFFLLVGLEIRRELSVGEISTWRKAALAIAAAVGGMAVPAAIYTAFNWGQPGARGWGIPVATDIAFSLAVLSLLGRRVPIQLKVFLTAFAIIDDIGAVIVIALFYAGPLQWIPLMAAVLCVAGMKALNVGRVVALWPYLATGALLWIACGRAGIHPTLAGVITAWCIPAWGSKDKNDSPASRLEHWLERPVGFIVIPLFGLANAGVSISALPALVDPITLGAFMGLVLGKPIGIFGLCWLAVRSKIAELPRDVLWSQMAGIGAIGGIGFTMSLFIGSLAFDERTMNDAAKAGILAASGVSGIVGALVLALSARNRRRNEQN